MDTRVSAAPRQQRRQQPEPHGLGAARGTRPAGAAHGTDRAGGTVYAGTDVTGKASKHGEDPCEAHGEDQ